jgi:hypothetical protein
MFSVHYTHITAIVLSSDVLLAFLVWKVAYSLHSSWGRGELSEIAVAAMMPSVAVWVGLRALGCVPKLL